MVKSYLRYQQGACFGVVNSLQCPVVYDWIGKHALTGGLDAVLVWNLRQGVCICTLRDPENTAQVTAIALSPDRKHVAAGYADGKVRVWEWSSGFRNVNAPVTLSGHRSAISALCYTQNDSASVSKGQLLCSGSRDGKLVVWDTIEQRGLFRLQGHKGEITHCQFLTRSYCLLSSSKDTLVKLWDLETQHCTQTLVGHRKEVWAFAVDKEEDRVYTGTADPFFRVYEIVYPAEDAPTRTPELKSLGNIARQSKERIVQLHLNPSGRLLACQAAGKTLELFHVFEGQDIARRRRRRQSRVKKKFEKQGDSEMKEEADIDEYKVTDEVAPAYSIMAEQKVSSCCFSPTAPQLLLGMSNNALQMYDLEEDNSSLATSISLPGHRSDVRSVALSSDDALLVTTSQDHTKIWNVHSQSPIRTMDTGYGLCSMFLPGNRHIVIGTKEGELELYEVGSGNLLEEQEAHKAEVWAIALLPDQSGIISGGADKKLKFWDFQLVESEERSTKVLSLVHTKTITMEDAILAATFSADGKFLAIALLDNTVKVFHADTMNFFLSLYGHKLPVLSLDISSDGTVLATASADKNVKLWGLDFGDCHRSIFAHDDNVMQIKFVPGTHYFFTVGKDKVVKYWDGDTYEKILSLPGHQGEIWGLAVSGDGEFVVTTSQDRSIRIWERTTEQIFIEEEREGELEKIFEASLEDDQPSLQEGAHESAMATTKSLATVRAGELLIEALEEAQKDKMKWIEYENTLAALEDRQKSSILGKRNRKGKQGEEEVAKPKPSALFQNKTASEYILSTLHDIPSNDLEQALLCMSFSEAIDLFSYIEDWIKRGLNTELACRVMFFLLKSHHHQIVSNRSLLQTLHSLQSITKAQLKARKNTIGFNRAAMGFLAREIEQNQNESLFREVTDKIAQEKRKRPRVN